MENPIGVALTTFEAELGSLRRSLTLYPKVADALFDGAQPWTELLRYKLVPHFRGPGCLFAALVGGTNTGKSTVFNVLVGRAISPVVPTAAATCRPVLAANALRCSECLESRLVPEFMPLPLKNSDDPVNPKTPSKALFVALVDDLPDHLVVMDTPDVDSIDKQNWEVAEHIRAAGDVLVAVVTGEKYKDDRVVQFFREAVQSGRIVLPLMNKADPANEFDVARQQLADFCKDVGTAGPCFIVAYNPELAENFDAPISALDGNERLRDHLERLDVPAIKRRVFSTTVRHFADRAGQFLDSVGTMANATDRALREMDNAASNFAGKYDPAPGAAVGGLFHAYVQSKRGPIRRTIGATSAGIVKTTSAIGRGVAKAFRRRALLEGQTADTPMAHYEQHRRAIERIVRDFAAELINKARGLNEPLRSVALISTQTWDAEAAAQAVVKEALKTNDVSQAFRDHARHTLDAWWNDHKGKRRVLESLDIMLALAPAAIAAPIAMHTGGIGASEAAIAIGPVAAQFVTRVMELQFGDAMFDFLSPWKKEQQALLERALRQHVSDPMTQRLRELSSLLEGATVDQLRKAQQTCQKA